MKRLIFSIILIFILFISWNHYKNNNANNNFRYEINQVKQGNFKELLGSKSQSDLKNEASELGGAINSQFKQAENKFNKTNDESAKNRTNEENKGFNSAINNKNFNINNVSAEFKKGYQQGLKQLAELAKKLHLIKEDNK
ncbi:hypothetical protein DY138_03135 [Apilactobacillus timberlakei]|uniref:hypothetical protein n=1 Tax=Apilactobacillus timberlakei TaxID=2008380 RepID=UPI00112E90C0|nr:hypothetical protein [Apilactobacillus timberlakei]TPR19655.1 hypothetical protein DY138_03135 [Apilactobacillus timberlakei]TPR20632.1 hypothetical protein DY061_04775 [Apilactobacillus timberlakei]TPR22675.1 hypothetical protein DY083_04045 [Apilactobacillus timberlakei]